MPSENKLSFDDYKSIRRVQLRSEIAEREKELELLDKNMVAPPSSGVVLLDKISTSIPPIGPTRGYSETGAKLGRKPLPGGIISGKYKPLIRAWMVKPDGLSMNELYELAEKTACAPETIDPLRAYIYALRQQKIVFMKDRMYFLVVTKVKKMKGFQTP